MDQIAETIAEIAEGIPPIVEESAIEQVLTPETSNVDFEIPEAAGSPFDIDSYDYETDSEEDETLDDELRYINAQLQWEESVQQVEKLMGWVILPLIGKVLGRRMSGVIWRKLWDYFG